ncbi:MAG: hypothetical protein A2284_04610 [Deltaproteobacteria bacterium RIFOXYA12_FULL_61_11]|nr:MAG: hypothetical protein A2284_04610 [Deltaproteobacteria bacterium RIFOXYA12_FULL_61_11]
MLFPLRLLLILTLFAGTLACSRPEQGDQAPKLQTPVPTSGASKVVRIVFIGRKHACECTAKAIAASTAALEQALGTPSSIPIERLDIDVDTVAIRPLLQQRPLQALPGIYLLDSAGTVLQLLQGQLTKEQVTAALQR